MWRAGLTVLVGALAAGGCTQVRHTDPPKTATHLFLLSVAIDNAIKPLAGDLLRGRLVYVDRSFAGDKELDYLVASVRAKLLGGGARLTDKRDEAEVVVEVRTQGVSIDRSEFLLGIPGLPIGELATTVGVPATTIFTPELAVVKNLKQWGTAGVAYVAYWRETGEIVASSGPHIGRSYREDWSFFGYGTTVSNIPPTRRPEDHETVAADQE